MQSSVIGKIEKARRYSEEKERIRFTSFTATLRGDHSDHQVIYNNGFWSCDCHYFRSNTTCSHAMALQRILEPMVASA